jgi:hypothetical protein
VDLYIHSPIRLHGVVLNSLSTGTTLLLSLGVSNMAETRTCEMEATPESLGSGCRNGVWQWTRGIYDVLIGFLVLFRI